MTWLGDATTLAMQDSFIVINPFFFFFFSAATLMDPRSFPSMPVNKPWHFKLPCSLALGLVSKQTDSGMLVSIGAALLVHRTSGQLHGSPNITRPVCWHRYRRSCHVWKETLKHALKKNKTTKSAQTPRRCVKRVWQDIKAVDRYFLFFFFAVSALATSS